MSFILSLYDLYYAAVKRSEVYWNHSDNAAKGRVWRTMARTERITVNMEAALYDRVAQYAKERGVSASRAVVELAERGFEAGVTAKEMTDALEILAEQVGAVAESTANRVDEALRQLSIARKNLGKTTQASCASLSLMSWFYRDFMVNSAEEFPDNERYANWALRGPDYLFEFFKSSGGALQPDPRLRYYPSFATACDREPFKNMSSEELAGLSRKRWLSALGRGNDAAAVRSLADRRSERDDG